MSDCVDICKRTTMSLTDNTAGLWWNRKGLATSTLLLSHILSLQSIYQWFHHYVTHHYFVIGVDTVISDHPSCSQYLMDATLLNHMDASHPQELSWRMWNPPSELVFEISSALRRTTSPRDSMIFEPPPMGTGQNGSSSVETWPLTPYSYCTGIR